jgi:hypothetical protein
MRSSTDVCHSSNNNPDTASGPVRLISAPNVHFVKQLCRIFSAVGLFWVSLFPGSGEAREIVFEGSKEISETRISLDEFGAGTPSNWSNYEALVIELRTDSPQRVSLKVYTGSPEKFSRVLLQFYPGAWLRVAIPISALSAAPTTGYDMASVGNRSRPGYYLGLWGPFVPLTAVTGIGFSMEKPIGSPRLNIRSLALARESPGDEVLGPLPLVDEFGQWIQADWPGKAKSLEELQAAWLEEGSQLKTGAFGYCRYGGYQNSKSKATGFFRVDLIDGRWWFVDPDGHLFLSVGSDVIQSGMLTRTTGREKYFKVLPPGNLSVKLPERETGASFFTWNLTRRFGENWRPKWADFTYRRMDDWGLNTVANWSDPELLRAAKKPYALPLGRWETKVSYLGLPDVYSEEFTANADRAARSQCEPKKNDPFLLGYFLANEPPFPQQEIQTTKLILSAPETATRSALQKWLQAGDTPERRKQFINDAFDRYIQVTSQAVKKYDPNHLNLGMRSGGRPTEAELRVSRAFDVYSVNVYDYQLSSERMEEITRLSGKPVIIGEFHFGVPERGLAASLVQVKNQAERGVAYRFYVEHAYAMPGLIGAHWFQWADQPATGRFDGENYNIGLVDVTDRPYRELIEALKITHERLYRVHSGSETPFDRRAQVH